MLGVAFAGALAAGLYGVLHDQITFTISPEYFTQMKFDQFRAADLGFSERVLVGEIGFLGTWWVGLISAWFFARMALPRWPRPLALRRIAESFAIAWVVAVLGAVSGFAFSRMGSAPGPFWQQMCAELGVLDVPAFACVGWIHYGSYCGGLLGLVAGIAYLRRARARL